MKSKYDNDYLVAVVIAVDAYVFKVKVIQTSWDDNNLHCCNRLEIKFKNGSLQWGGRKKKKKLKWPNGKSKPEHKGLNPLESPIATVYCFWNHETKEHDCLFNVWSNHDLKISQIKCLLQLPFYFQIVSQNTLNLHVGKNSESTWKKF